MIGRVAAVALLLGLLLGSSMTPAAAQEADSGDVALQDVTVENGRLRFLVTGLDPVPGSAALTGPVTLRIDGHAVDATAVVPRVQPEPVSRTTMLVIDSSQSMAGPLLAEAQAAAASFLDAAPAADHIGLISFADRPVLLAPPSAPRDAVRAAVRGLTAAGKTSLYDAVDLALGTLGTGGEQQILVLSDGDDTTSVLGLPDLLARLRAAQARTDIVRIGPTAAGPADPQFAMIAQAGRGQVFQARDAREATQVFRDQAVPDVTTLAVEAALPPGLTASTVRLHLSLSWGGRPVEADTSIELAPGSVVPVAGDPTLLLAVGLAGIFAALSLLVLALVAVPRSTRDRRRAQALVARYGAGSRRVATVDRAGGGLRQGALQIADRVAATRGIGDRLAARLDRAAVAWLPNEWLLLSAGIAAAMATVLTVLLGSPLAGLPLGVLGGVLGPQVFLIVRGARRVADFGADLPDALQLVASGLSSGYSLPQALDSVVRLGEGPVAVEVGRALAQSRLGTPVEDALDQAADRIGSVDLRWVVMAIRVQREVGGNLAEVLLQVAETIRERAWLRRHVKALSAEGRLSGVILAALPVVVAGYMFVVRRDYVGVLITEPLGLVMLAIGVVLLGIGMFWMNKIAKVEL